MLWSTKTLNNAAYPPFFADPPERVPCRNEGGISKRTTPSDFLLRKKSPPSRREAITPSDFLLRKKPPPSRREAPLSVTASPRTPKARKLASGNPVAANPQSSQARFGEPRRRATSPRAGGCPLTRFRGRSTFGFRSLSQEAPPLGELASECETERVLRKLASEREALGANSVRPHG